MTDRLFLINPHWTDDHGGPWYCPAGAVVEGVLAFYPALTTQLDITRLDFPRPVRRSSNWSARRTRAARS